MDNKRLILKKKTSGGILTSNYVNCGQASDMTGWKRSSQRGIYEETFRNLTRCSHFSLLWTSKTGDFWKQWHSWTSSLCDSADSCSVHLGELSFSFGVPQWMILGPSLFPLNTLSLASMFKEHILVHKIWKLTLSVHYTVTWRPGWTWTFSIQWRFQHHI